MWASLQTRRSLLNSLSEKARGGVREWRDEEHKRGKVIFRQLNVSRHLSLWVEEGQKWSWASEVLQCRCPCTLQAVNLKLAQSSMLFCRSKHTCHICTFCFFISQDVSGWLIDRIWCESGHVSVLNPDWRDDTDGCVRRFVTCLRSCASLARRLEVVDGSWLLWFTGRSDGVLCASQWTDSRGVDGELVHCPSPRRPHWISVWLLCRPCSGGDSALFSWLCIFHVLFLFFIAVGISSFPLPSFSTRFLNIANSRAGFHDRIWTQLFTWLFLDHAAYLNLDSAANTQLHFINTHKISELGSIW